MKIYETKAAPNPRRVRLFLAEKGIDVDFIQLDIKAGENRQPEMLNKNPAGHVPFLELDDGTIISESLAICRFFEENYPDKPLMGTAANEKAVIEMHQRLVEFEFFVPIMMCFQHKTGFFKDRMTPIMAWGEQTESMAKGYLDVLNKQLAISTYVAGETFSIADITLLCGIDFARVVNIRLRDDHEHLLRWYEMVSQRPAMKGQ